MASEARKSLEERAQRAILQYSFFRTESAVVLAITLLLTALAAMVGLDSPPFPDILETLFSYLPWFTWLGGGLLGEAALVYSSLTDPEAHRRVVAKMLQDEFKPERLRHPWLQQQVNEAFEYRSRITGAIRERRESVLKDHLADTASQLDEWLEEVYGLAQRLDRYQTERELHTRNRERGTERLQQLRERLGSEPSPAVRQDIEHNIDSLERQLKTIAELENAMARARLRLENTLTAMGTIYTQTMLVGAKDIDSGRAKRLRQEISDEVHELSDVLSAMDEVYAGESTL